MSYERVIGFGVDEKNPKGPIRPLTGKESLYFYRMGVEPIFHDLKKMMGADNREPEKKIIVPTAKSFLEIRNLIASAKNAFLIPDQIYTDKNPLTSILLDTVENGFPAARLDKGNHTLRYRFEVNPQTGEMTKGDYNEKSAIYGGQEIGGCTDRIERELEQRPGESFERGYNAFLNKYRRRQDPAFCNDVPFADLRVFGGYQTARNEIGFAVKRDKMLIVFEGCEDFWHILRGDMTVMDPPKFFEFEFEPKQAWGELPAGARTKEGFKAFIYDTMSNLESYIQEHTARSYINRKSKAELTKEHIESMLGFDEKSLADLGLSALFAQHAEPHSQFSAVQYSLMMAANMTLQEALDSNLHSLNHHGNKLYAWKQNFNELADKSRPSTTFQTHLFRFQNDNSRQQTQQPVAALS
jgi:hypothetical protein